tara:strand:+ start:1595 stop:1936 length:342 start_codon:yes stop_codon:yes gene_type:complete
MKGTYLMAGKTLSAVCKNKKEITFTESLDESEVIAIMAFCKAKKIGCVFTQSKRLLILECNNISDALDVLSEFGLIEYMGSLKEITEWDLNSIESPEEEIDIIFTPENEDNKI